MNRRLIYIVIGTIFVASGCFSSSPKRSSSAVPSLARATGKIIKEDEFKKGGTLVVLPFKAGPNAAASPQLDRVSLMIAKGLIDRLSEEKTPFTVLTTQDQGEPDLVVGGYINDFIQPGKVKRWVMQSKKTALSVDGYIDVHGSKERILIFQHKQLKADPKKDGLDLAYKTGQELGRFIIEALQE
jgi:hypothetical protein